MLFSSLCTFYRIITIFILSVNISALNAHVAVPESGHRLKL